MALAVKYPWLENDVLKIILELILKLIKSSL